MPATIEQIKAWARGNEGYRSHRLKVARTILQSREAPTDLPKFLQDRFFDISRRPWVVLGVTDRDWQYLSQLSAASESVDAWFCTLATAAIKANAKTIEHLYKFDKSFSRTFLQDGPDAASKLIGELSGTDAQSLYAFRVMAAINSSQGDDLIPLFEKQFLSDWIKQRFLYPFVYYHLNNPPDSQIEY